MSKILVACEESQRVTAAFRALGHEAYSCDVRPPSGGHPEWHTRRSVIPLLGGHCAFHTLDGELHEIDGQWDLIIAFPPCTYLTVTGNRWFNVERYGDKARERIKQRGRAQAFFMLIATADCPRIAIENPVGVMSTFWRKPDQIVHPFFFGDPERKKTCLWLKGLPPLRPTNMVEPNVISYKRGFGTDSLWHMDTIGLPPDERSRLRSQTYPGFAAAMAEQWGCLL